MLSLILITWLGLMRFCFLRLERERSLEEFVSFGYYVVRLHLDGGLVYLARGKIDAGSMVTVNSDGTVSQYWGFS